MSDARTTMVIADANEMTRRGLRALLHAQPDLHVDAECATARETVVEVERFGSRMLVMDPALPDASGFETCRRLCERLPALHVVMLIARPVERTVVAGLRAGATAILSKRASLSDIRDTVRAAAAGVARLDGLATAALVEHVRHPSARLDGDAALTDVERRVLARVVAGRTNKQIGHELALSETTVKSHLSRAFTKLHVTRRARAAVLFVANGGIGGADSVGAPHRAA